LAHQVLATSLLASVRLKPANFLGTPFASFKINSTTKIEHVFQTDGNYVVKRVTGKSSKILVSTDIGSYSCTSNSCQLAFGDDGDLIIFIGGGEPAWSSGTITNPSYLVFRSSNDVVDGLETGWAQIVDDTGYSLWGFVNS
jgi:hypothetical protein